MAVFKELIFNSFLLWEDVVVMKQLIFNSFYFMVGFAGLKRTDCLTVSTLSVGCDGHVKGLIV